MAHGSEIGPSEKSVPSASPSPSPRMRAGGIVLRPGTNGAAPEVLFVSRRRDAQSYTVPAGKFEEDKDGTSFKACALRETREEAGVEGNIIFDLGWHKGMSKDRSVTRTRFFGILFRRELPGDWAEEHQRIRSWRGINEAKDIVAHSPMLVGVFREVDKVLAQRASGGADPLDDSQAASAGSREQRDVSPVSSDNESLGLPETEGGYVSGKPPSTGSMLPSRPSASSLSPCAADDASSCREESDPQDLESKLKIQVSTSAAASPRAASPKANEAEKLQRKASYDAMKSMRIEDLDGERFCFYNNQAGGHFCLVKPAPENTRIMIRPSRNGRPPGPPTEIELPAHSVVLKPLDEKEYAFYQDLMDEAPQLIDHIAQLFGTKTLTHRQVSAMTAEVDKIVKDKDSVEENFLETRMRSHRFQTYIVMQDLASTMASPCILDLKMGFKQRSQRHSEKKRQRSKDKAETSTSHFLGFRICGIHAEGRCHDKYWGRRLVVDQIHGALAEFFLHAQAGPHERHQLVSCILERLRELRAIIAGLLSWRFWSTSLLFLYDGLDLGKKPEVRMIDFAHCTRIKGNTPDEEMLTSLTNLETFLEALLDGHPYTPWIDSRLSARPSEAIQDAEEVENVASPNSFHTTHSSVDSFC